MTLPTWKNAGRTTAWRPSAPRAGCLTTGELTSLFSYVMGVLMSLMMLSMVFVMVTMSAASAHRIAEVLTETPDITSPANAVHDITDGSIDFDHVNFCYKHGSTGEDTLHDIDLHIKSGETIGIIGGTGCGKSSLVNLISRLYDATEGCVKVGGRDVREYDTEALRDQVAVVLQKNVLFSGSILDNLRWGKEDATEEECRQACIQAQTDEFIQRRLSRMLPLNSTFFCSTTATWSRRAFGVAAPAHPGRPPSRSLRGVVPAADQVHQAGFPQPCPDDADGLAALDVQVDVVQGVSPVERVCSRSSRGQSRCCSVRCRPPAWRGW